MAFFDWNDALSTGIPVIDKQHKVLVDIVNRLHESMMKRKAKEIMSEILDELNSYTKYHFATEEKAFVKYGYKLNDEHAKHHAELIQKLQELIEKQKTGNMMVSLEMLKFLIDWVGNHIMKEDMLYKEVLIGKEIME